MLPDQPNPLLLLSYCLFSTPLFCVLYHFEDGLRTDAFWSAFPLVVFGCRYTVQSSFHHSQQPFERFIVILLVAFFMIIYQSLFC